MASNPRDCVPLQPFGEDEPPVQRVNGEFFRVWAARLGWKDGDMLQQVVLTGSDSRSECSRDTVVFGHHTGLRRAFGPAHKSVMADVAEGWILPGRADLWTVPARVVPKNMVLLKKWRFVDGELRLVDKWRLTTDDSMEAGVSPWHREMRWWIRTIWGRSTCPMSGVWRERWR